MSASTKTMDSLPPPTVNDLPSAPQGKMGWPWTSDRSPLPPHMADGSPWPKVTIVTPSYNQGEFLEETIRSVLLQGYPNLEYIVMDGGSTDRSVEVMRKYEPWLADWVSEKDKGQADAINKGWQRSTGYFQGWINSDDTLLPACLESEVRYFHENPDVGIVFGDLERMDVNSERFGKATFKEFDIVELVRSAGWIGQPGTLIRRTVFEKVGLLDTSLHFMMDFDLWCRAGLICKFGYLPQPVAGFRSHQESKSSTHQDWAIQDLMSVYTKLFGRDDLPAEVRAVETEAWSSAYFNASQRLFYIGQLDGARANLKRALQIDPMIAYKRHRIKYLILVAIASAAGYSFARKLKATLANLGN